ncbi:hypothetical protein [Flavobacterium tiangeerense]|uniref:hypothetical protein n=1 Tax=Flavobacterium tiangeerense TaxID=459471 RepID=UPI00119F0EB1|nr:hypothetical protein [Flavobacterium tiangeerense]
MKKATIILLLVFLNTVCQAKYRPLILSELIDNAEFIGNGTIINVEKNNIVVQFSMFYKGNSKYKIFRIQKFKDWTCASRWAEYRIGQEEVFFFSLNQNRKMVILGAGNEGEIPIYKNNVIYKNTIPFDKTTKNYTIEKNEINGYSFSLYEFKSGIETYLSNKNYFKNCNKKKSKMTKNLNNTFLEKLVFELQ